MCNRTENNSFYFLSSLPAQYSKNVEYPLISAITAISSGYVTFTLPPTPKKKGFN